jgi:hypothetical protein
MGVTASNIAQPQNSGVVNDIIESIRSTWKKGEEDRLKLGEQFSELRKETANYKKGKSGLSYNQAVEKTGVPHSTAEKYRGMYESCRDHKIPANNFLQLCESGLNLAAVAVTKDGPTVAGILHAHPELMQQDSVIDFTKIKEKYVKQQPEAGNLPEIIAGLESTISELEGLKKDSLKKTIDEKKHELYAKQESALKALVTALAPFIGWDNAQVENFITDPALNRWNFPGQSSV